MFSFSTLIVAPEATLTMPPSAYRPTEPVPTGAFPLSVLSTSTFVLVSKLIPFPTKFVKPTAVCSLSSTISLLLNIALTLFPDFKFIVALFIIRFLVKT